MKIKFTKMHGAGNDFVVIDGVTQHIDLTPAQWQFIGNRRLGIGADQVLLVEKAQAAGIDFRYRIFNADGGEVEQCGNGSRAFVKFVTDKGLTAKHTIRVETMTGVIEPRLEADGQITVDMGAPVLQPSDVPFDTSGLNAKTEGEDALWPLDINGKLVWISVISMGNPHAVQLVDDVESAPLASDGPKIETHPRFPRRVNAGFMQVLDRHQIKIRVFERGVGETLACGTGACAAVVAGVRRGLLDSPVTVHARGGDLTIAWDGAGKAVQMTGPAVTVFEGEIELP